MYLNSFSIFTKTFQILAIFIIFTILVDATLSMDPNFEACMDTNCGNGPNVSYPFWISNQQESYCGHPNFEVTCNDKNAVIGISGHDYVIKDVFYNNNSFLLEDTMVFDFTNTCPILGHNFSIEGTPFDYSVTYADLYFFYYCTKFPVEQTYPVACASNATHFSFAVFHMEILEFKNYSIESCRSWVNAPVESEDIKKLLAMNFTDVLRKGFVLQWNESDCSGCKYSGGRCGSVDDEFICFCPDRQHSRTCYDENRLNLPVKLGIGFASAGGTLLLMMGFVFFIHHRCVAKRSDDSHTSSVMDLERVRTYCGIRTFTYNELKQATHNFDPKKEVGDGGYGSVYQGKLRNGRVVAVKRLYEHNHKRVQQFTTEVEILTCMRHQNLVSLYGCTSRHSRELLLVYEYIPNGTLADHLHGDRAKPYSLLSWSTRMSIAIETASALAYLHASECIHRDVKTTNILLDNNFCVKVADFGLSRLFPTDVSHISTTPQGTLGYVDPEYYESYQLTDKSDVYNFGVVLIELISSKPAVDMTRNRHEINLSNMAINKIQNQVLHDLVDLGLGFELDYKVRKMITEVATLAFQCLQNGRDMRPSMKEVLENLKRIQSEDYDARNAEEVKIQADDVVMLRSDPPTLHPSPRETIGLAVEETANVSG
ncbi:LEAF RUST 10 DISEASE-RESISTANCE LOCUS RECEPTOR-LIKE PROTEIN KINASE-like 1.2 [Actinidia eriantha]|uniref:LEAF RUST 10 DISEASE-RESISTANCE LOCUS RECEPTOR-LIKE PROTEIN KINASE-like 1.2 n=1 Tax=Actinidia eriantha TaxID=165200 RepID=UPI00258685D2|nr:LEAF RUST 10 DISEASE-RESISTANCE LOCUS RECEPTOR-LIKE PROTEIN KINASE-like 1.2 [Actinidia eriantha]